MALNDAMMADQYARVQQYVLVITALLECLFALLLVCYCRSSPPSDAWMDVYTLSSARLPTIERAETECSLVCSLHELCVVLQSHSILIRSIGMESSCCCTLLCSDCILLLVSICACHCCCCFFLAFLYHFWLNSSVRPIALFPFFLSVVVAVVQ